MTEQQIDELIIMYVNIVDRSIQQAEYYAEHDPYSSWPAAFVIRAETYNAVIMDLIRGTS